MRLPTFRAAALAVLLFAGGTLAEAKAEPELLLDYDVRYGGVTIMKLQARLDLAEGSDEGYAVALQGRTVGLVDKLTPIAFTAHSQGAENGKGLQPALYSTTTRKRDKRKGLSIAFQPGGAPVTRFTPADDAEEPAPPELLEGSIDPASGMIALLRSVAETDACSGTVPIFDGKRRYDVTFLSEPQESITQTSHSVYSGKLTVCRLKSKPLHGFKPGKRRPLDDTVIWLGRVLEGAPPLPVRVETEISLGAVRLELASARWADRQASR
jgi:hypothetical protein